MKAREPFDLPPEQEAEMGRAKRLAWATIAALTAMTTAMYLVMGGSQAMKAAWVEDLLSFVAPVAFLVSARYRHRSPTESFPYGYHRSVNVAFLAGAVALLLFGAFLLFDSTMTLVRAEHPTIGTSVILGKQIWSGWLMIVVLLLTGIPPFVLGRLKMGPARKLHDKTLKADADMNRADWLTAAFGAGGVAGIGLGLWWADAAAGAAISTGIVKDGVTNLRQVVEDLMDGQPRTVDGEVSDTPERIRHALDSLPWVEAADVRLREEGHLFTGEVFLTVRATDHLEAKLLEARETASSVDWRVRDLVVELHLERRELAPHP